MMSANQMLREIGQEAREVTLWLKLEEGEVQHYCFFCRQGLFRSRLRVFAMLSGLVVIEPFVAPPFSVQCPKCGTVYHCSGVVG